ncbi:MAG TPA: hypothetical protein VHD32_09715 [Candidatus Didemnitutus sp.]|nr:hypothetical protein [Candidatus Didemnitutus sp.]
MKSIACLILGGIALITATLFFSGCVAEGDGGGGYVDTDVYYGPDYDRPWFRGGGWIYGSRGYYETHHYHNGGDVYINPPRTRHAPTPEHHEPTHRSAPSSHPAPTRPGGHDNDHGH